MGGANGGNGAFPFDGWSDSHAAVYRAVLHRERSDVALLARDTGLSREESDALVADLLAMRLLRADEDGEGTVVAADPRLAAAHVLAPAELAVRQQQREVDSFRAGLAELTAAFTDNSRDDQDSCSVQWIRDLDIVLSHIAVAARDCEREVLAAQPGGAQSANVLDEALPRDLELLRRGVRMRMLYQHTTRFDPPTQLYVEQVTRVGAEVRTLSEFFERMIIFDRKLCFVAVPDRPTEAVVVRQPALVEFLCGVFDRVWSGAESYSGTADGYLNARAHSEEIHSRIVDILADGVKDEVAARRLGMSVRTLRKHIAVIMQEMGAESRFQLGWLMGSQRPAGSAPSSGKP
ncbi:LuxR family transcriptional regulator [Streptomyces sp. NPDC049099]|uniref:LuxR family transcriptional regulator n=1 Tax=unclassified Streptomyces TaxID=2593676 RepID=UPI003440DB39